MLARFTLASLAILASTTLFQLPTAVEGSVIVNMNGVESTFAAWDPFLGSSDPYKTSGILFLGQVNKDCTITISDSVTAAAQAIQVAVGPGNQQTNSIMVMKYDWLDWCATYDDIFSKLPGLSASLTAHNLPPIGAILMDGNAQSTEDFGSPFTQLADASHWNRDSGDGFNISYTGSDTVVTLATALQTSGAFIATVIEDPGPWNNMWTNVGTQVLVRGMDALTALVFFYGLWVLIFIVKANQDKQHLRRYLVLVPGILYLPLSIAFAPYKTTVPWRNAMYYASLLLPFISLGLQITMWSTLIYRIKRLKINKFFYYFSYITIGVPSISSFLDGIGWLIPSVPIVRVIGERGFSYATPAVILIQAIMIFYFAITFFQSLRKVAVSETTRKALIKITLLNLAMISFFILMLLSRLISLFGLNMRMKRAYLVELCVFRCSFVFFYAACFRTLSIREPTGSTVGSKNSGNHNGASGGGAGTGGQGNTNSNKVIGGNHFHYKGPKENGLSDTKGTGSSTLAGSVGVTSNGNHNGSTTVPKSSYNPDLYSAATMGPGSESNYMSHDYNMINSSFDGSNRASMANKSMSFKITGPKSPRFGKQDLEQQEDDDEGDYYPMTSPKSSTSPPITYSPKSSRNSEGYTRFDDDEYVDRTGASPRDVHHHHSQDPSTASQQGRLGGAVARGVSVSMGPGGSTR